MCALVEQTNSQTAFMKQRQMIRCSSVCGDGSGVRSSCMCLCVCVCVCAVGSVCCSYAGRHTNCREYCQAIFRTDSSPTVSQISAVKEYCQSISPQLIGCVVNYTKSYPIRSPIDSKCTLKLISQIITEIASNTLT